MEFNFNETIEKIKAYKRNNYKKARRNNMQYLIYGLSKLFDWFGLIKSPARRRLDEWYK